MSKVYGFGNNNRRISNDNQNNISQELNNEQTDQATFQFFVNDEEQ